MKDICRHARNSISRAFSKRDRKTRIEGMEETQGCRREIRKICLRNQGDFGKCVYLNMEHALCFQSERSFQLFVNTIMVKLRKEHFKGCFTIRVHHLSHFW